MIFAHSQKILFMGASLTDCGRREEHAPYGNGFMSLIRAFVDARYPELGLNWVNHGVGGDTVRELAARWDRDVIAERPDWISLQLPANDVWRFFGDHPEQAVSVDEYETTVRSLLQRSVDGTRARLIVAEPMCINADPADPMRAMIDTYGAVARRVAGKFDAIVIRQQQAFDAALATTSPRDWSDDGVHPFLPGHAVIALAYLRSFGFTLDPSSDSKS